MRPLFTQAWVDRVSPVVKAAMTATIRVYTPDLGASYDVETDTWTQNPETVYEGPARVQPVRSSRFQSDTTVQTVRFQVPVEDSFDVRVDMHVRVIDSPLNRNLEGREFVVVQIVDSSNPVEQTFEATVDNELVVD